MDLGSVCGGVWILVKCVVGYWFGLTVIAMWIRVERIFGMDLGYVCGGVWIRVKCVVGYASPSGRRGAPGRLAPGAPDCRAAPDFAHPRLIAAWRA